MKNELSASVPRVTVLMPVYNGAAYLRDAIASILRQTFADFELLIIDDGSTDGSSGIITDHDDHRIRVLHHPVNRGLVASLNVGIDSSRGDYIARMDADDISYSHRLSSQIAFMDANPDVGVCGSWLEAFDQENATVWSPPVTHEEISASLLFESTIYHPTVIMRKRYLETYNLRYDERYPHAEDYDLWSRCGSHFRLSCIGEVLLRYRLHEDSVGERHKSVQSASADRVRERLLDRLDIRPTPAEALMHRSLSLWQTKPESCFVLSAHEWLLKLMEGNRRTGAFPEPAFTKVLAQRWRYVCFQAADKGFFAYRQLQSSPLIAALPLSAREKLQMLGRCLVRQSRGRYDRGNVSNGCN